METLPIRHNGLILPRQSLDEPRSWETGRPGARSRSVPTGGIRLPRQRSQPTPVAVSEAGM